MRAFNVRSYCQHKHGHATAGSAAAQLRKSQNARHRLGLYRCPCGDYHIGHIDRRALIIKRVVRIFELEN